MKLRTSPSPVAATIASNAAREFLHDVLRGLSRRPRSIPCKYFYDQRGAVLFERICELDEYYLTRAELEILQTRGPEIAELVGPGALVYEPGGGSLAKAGLLLRALQSPAAYVPVDIACEQLRRSARQLAESAPALPILPLCADFTHHPPPPPFRARRTLVFFPGSTIGNFDLHQARSFLKRLAALAGPGGALLIGFDLQKDPAVLEAAYNDPAGITAAFNLNLLRRINDELGADFDLESFRHQAVYLQKRGRIDMRLVSTRDQLVRIAGHDFHFRSGDYIHTESSHKYTAAQFEGLVSRSGWKPHQLWTDGQERFALLCARR
jgi:L-histidine Nalpha-methyltransferase